MANVETIERPKRKQTDADTLWAAFAAAQERFGPIMKATKGARGKYAPLDVVLEMARPILNECGLVLTQPTQVEGDTLFVHTTLVHKATGEAHACSYPAGVITQQHQLLGAGVTYARRYSLLSILAVFPENEDDDGERAGAAGGSSPPPRQQQPAIRHEAQRFITNAKAKIATAGDDIDAANAVLDALKELPSWKQLNAAEQAAIREAMPRLPDDVG
jgi:hypothetical protein